MLKKRSILSLEQKEWLEFHWIYLLLSFMLPVIIMMVVYLLNGIYPGSERSVLASDAFSQFSNFHASFRNMLLGKQGLFYSWQASIGLNYLALAAYYLGGIFTPLVLFFPNQLMPDALFFLTLIKIGAMGLSFFVFAYHSYRKLQHLEKLALATCYALLSFAIAHSEIIMWLDAFIYLPLIILGINRVIEKQRYKTLFFSYFLLFISNFYMAFMIGVFSVLYFFAQLLIRFKATKKAIIPYFVTAFLSGGASMFIVLPTVMDLRTNGETLSTFTKLKTEATGWLDLIMKNFIGVYDGTKYGSIPFIFVGVLSLYLCLLYFVSLKVNWRNKLAYGAIFAILIASFYLQPLNLFWHGFHAPNMFLFRYAFLFSFLVLYLAGYGLELAFETKPMLKISLGVGLLAIFSLSYLFKPASSYTYVSQISLFATILFLAAYSLLLALSQTSKRHYISVLLLLFVIGEMGINSYQMIKGIREDWVYASRILYTGPYEDIATLVDSTKKANNSFYRLENLDGVSVNDSFNYNYAGIGMFSSMRNRHASSLLHQLGFQSRGTNLNLRYQNNTLLMDSLFDVKYNIATQDIEKYGFQQIESANQYQLFENTNALGLGLLTDPTIFNVQLPENDNLTSQTNLFNALAKQNNRYYQFMVPKMVQKSHSQVDENGSITTFTQESANLEQTITWEITLPKNSQAYLSLFPFDFAKIGTSKVTIDVNGQKRTTQIDINGQYYNLGNYSKSTKLRFTTSFSGEKEIKLIAPKILILDTQAFQKAVNQLKTQTVQFKTKGHLATAQFNAKTEQVLFTTIAYDKGWHAYIDGKKTSITAFKEGLLAIKVPKGKHHLVLKYYPPGLFLGCTLSISSGLLFFVFYRYQRKKLSQQL
ncbi:YfhO family protein [Enterococcus columbae]|uniref:ABC transporter membrane protein n=1 Tax=Enterococcus columbae DSM 7374 = ATCC 51263 TaxID=1121865 RepID=S0K6E8_9ENTE|nr:YfhO family protein [Enterococcus columbae]EOT40624.1 hypothetical protein OMW_01486 [Enterococcus columbae DSM 7374 = ATCC 51263]EOW80400.1 hypothetical protein I568_02100 [Enterococcus columbae DSM 7374 = ATCC 51263]OJG24213.1 hypothetical protein RR47_GL000299 [Enterococcus columbae DSM 7374 = ATCC 51263]